MTIVEKTSGFGVRQDVYTITTTDNHDDTVEIRLFSGEVAATIRTDGGVTVILRRADIIQLLETMKEAFVSK